MDLRLREKVAIITGGAKGIGEAITRSFASEGAIAVILGRNPEEAEAVIASLGAAGLQADHYQVELTDYAAVGKTLATVVERFGRLDVLINNAGVNDGVGLEQGPDAFEASLRKNLGQVFNLTHLAAPHLRRAKGAIVNIGSKVAVTGQGGTSAYAAAKGAINGLTREWALDLARDGVRVNAVIPAEVLTPLYERFLETRRDPESTRKVITDRIPLEHRFTTAEEIANMTVFLASPVSGHTTGQIIYVDGGYTHLDRMYGLMTAE